MVATAEKRPKSDTKIIVKDSEYLPIDDFLSRFKPCPLQIYSRGEYPGEERINQLSKSLYLEDTVSVIEAINWFNIPEDIGEVRLAALGLTGVAPGNYLINGNTRYIALYELRKELDPKIFTDILCQEIDITQSTYKDLYDIQEFFNGETVKHTRMQQLKAIANLIRSLEARQFKSKDANKVAQARHQVSPTDVTNARKIFLEPKYDLAKLQRCMELVDTGFMSADTMIVLLDLISNANVNLGVDEAIAKLAETHPSLKSDEPLLTRTMVYGLRNKLLKKDKNKTGNTNNDGDGNSDEDDSAANKTPLTEEQKKEKLAQAQDAIRHNIEFLKKEIMKPDQINEETKISYRDSFPLLGKISGDIADAVPIEDIDKVFIQQAEFVIGMLEKYKEQMTFEQYQSIARRTNSLYNKIV